ncbi:MAG: acylphosphatase [Pseudomonadota bacterium]
MPQRRYRIEGRVQGVWFRESTRREAAPRGITGHAVNHADGSVEVWACGDDRALDRLERWLAKGPPLARVNRLTRMDDPDDPVPDTFRTG